MIGGMRYKMMIQSERRTVDTDGSAALRWYDDVEVYADIKPNSGRERFFGMQLEGSVTHTITIRYRADMVPKKRLLYGTRAFQVRAVINRDERKRFMELLCEEGVAT
jgi:SPP1 family predicted phage head-tail adaptor